MNIKREIRRRFQKGDIFKIWRITRCKETIFSFSFYSVKWQIEEDYFKKKKMKYKTSTSSEPGPHG